MSLNTAQTSAISPHNLIQASGMPISLGRTNVHGSGINDFLTSSCNSNVRTSEAEKNQPAETLEVEATLRTSRAFEAMQSGQIETACCEIQTELELTIASSDPVSLGVTYFMHAWIHEEAGKISIAATSYRKCFELLAQSDSCPQVIVGASLRLSLILQAQGNSLDALDFLGEAVKRVPLIPDYDRSHVENTLDGVRNFANLATLRNDFEVASIGFSTASDLSASLYGMESAEYFEDRIGQVDSEICLGHFSAARESLHALRPAIAAFPSLSSQLDGREIEILLGFDEIDAAVKISKDILARNTPDDEDTNSTLAQAHLALGQESCRKNDLSASLEHHQTACRLISYDERASVHQIVNTHAALAALVCYFEDPNAGDEVMRRCVTIVQEHFGNALCHSFVALNARAKYLEHQDFPIRTVILLKELRQYVQELFGEVSAQYVSVSLRYAEALGNLGQTEEQQKVLIACRKLASKVDVESYLDTLDALIEFCSLSDNSWRQAYYAYKLCQSTELVFGARSTETARAKLKLSKALLDNQQPKSALAVWRLAYSVLKTAELPAIESGEIFQLKAEIYSAARKHDQAIKNFGIAKRFFRDSGTLNGLVGANIYAQTGFVWLAKYEFIPSPPSLEAALRNMRRAVELYDSIDPPEKGSYIVLLQALANAEELAENVSAAEALKARAEILLAAEKIT